MKDVSSIFLSGDFPASHTSLLAGGCLPSRTLPLKPPFRRIFWDSLPLRNVSAVQRLVRAPLSLRDLSVHTFRPSAVVVLMATSHLFANGFPEFYAYKKLQSQTAISKCY